MDNPDYDNEFYRIQDFLCDIPGIAGVLTNGINEGINFLQKVLPTAKEFIDTVRNTAPEAVLRAVLTDDQKQKIRDGVLEFMCKKNGSLMAVLIDPQTKHTVYQVPLEAVKEFNPEILAKLSELTAQIQMAQVSIQMNEIQNAIEEVRQGQVSDRLSTAYSCQQKLLQAQCIKNPDLKRNALLKIAFDAEDSRNLLMQSQGTNISKLKDQPQDFIGKIFKGESTDKIDSRINELRDSLEAINMVSLTEAMAYQDLGEFDAARQSLEYYSGYLEQAYLASDGLINRLDSMDSSTDCEWTKRLSQITRNINTLPCMKGEENGRKEIL